MAVEDLPVGKQVGDVRGVKRVRQRVADDVPAPGVGLREDLEVLHRTAGAKVQLQLLIVMTARGSADAVVSGRSSHTETAGSVRADLLERRQPGCEQRDPSAAYGVSTTHHCHATRDIRWPAHLDRHRQGSCNVERPPGGEASGLEVELPADQRGGHRNRHAADAIVAHR